MASSYRDWYRQGPLGGLPKEDRTLRAGPIHLINVSPPPGEVVEPPLPEFALHLLVRTAPLLRVGFNRPPCWLAVAPGSMLLAPPDTACTYAGNTGAHVLTVAIPKACVEDFGHATGTRVEVHREEAFRDPALARGLLRLWHELSEPAPARHLLADQALRSLLEALGRRAGARRPPGPGRERLAHQTVRRLRDFVESRLADDLDVAEMSEVAELSPAHFARAFAATVGMTPFRYLMTRRLARARELLERTPRSILDIALDVGFKTPSHFTSRFHREYGVTPRELRAEARRPGARLAEPGGRIDDASAFRRG